jgi:hypothetical protein
LLVKCRRFGRRGGGKIALEFSGFQRDGRNGAAALQGRLPFARVAEKSNERSEQVGTEPSAVRIEAAQRGFFHDVNEKILRQILDLGRWPATNADELDDGPAIATDELRQRPGRRGVAVQSRSGQQRPLGRRKLHVRS